MALLQDLPPRVLDLITSGSVSEYVTISAAGLPIDTPVLFFPSDDLTTLDLATGLAYPAKAERARRNPRIGLLVEGGADEPVVSIAGMAAVRDADLQANVDRYLAEAAYTLAHDPDWSLAREAVWYWTRMLVEITPASIVWWDSPAAMAAPPHRLDAVAGTTFPRSDPASPGTGSPPAKWQERPWRDLAEQALSRQVPGYVSVIDVDGFPRPIRALSLTLDDRGFVIDLPGGLPWATTGAACLTFGGIETFVGDAATIVPGRTRLTVARALPIFPMTQDMTQLWEPTADTREQLMRRLEQETARRGQPIPMIPEIRPEPSAGYKRRLSRLQAPTATHA